MSLAGVFSSRSSYMSINSVRTNGPTLCPIVWLPYGPNMLKNLLERHTVLSYIGVCIHNIGCRYQYVCITSVMYI